MANSGGGFILFGIKDRRPKDKTCEDRIVGMPIGGDLRADFGRKIAAIQPDVHFDAIPAPLRLPDADNCGVFVVRIPRSPRRPHVLDGCFYKRGAGGTCEPMDYYGVQEQMLYREGILRKVTLLRLEIKSYRQIVKDMLEMGDNVTGSLLRFDTASFKSIVAEICTVLPPGPQGTVFLEALLEIPSVASIVNESLARYSGPIVIKDPRKASYRIEHNVRVLDERCDRVEGAFDELFGPLTGPA